MFVCTALLPSFFIFYYIAINVLALTSKYTPDALHCNLSYFCQGCGAIA